MPIKVFVIEDEYDVLQELVNGLQEDPLIEVCGYAQEVEEAFEKILATVPDALFLDIQLDGGTGFDLLSELDEAGFPAIPVIINTGFEYFEYAQRALNDYGDRIVHILQKPFFAQWEVKRKECISKIRSFHSGKTEVSPMGSFNKFIARSKNTTFLIDFEDIQYLEVAGSGNTYLQAKGREAILIHRTLEKILPDLPDYIFRISRYHAVHLDAIKCLLHEDKKVQLEGVPQEFKVGEEYFRQLLRLLG